MGDSKYYWWDVRWFWSARYVVVLQDFLSYLTPELLDLTVILDIHPFFSTLIILSGWAAKTAVAQLVGEWIGGGTQMSQDWLVHSIP